MTQRQEWHRVFDRAVEIAEQIESGEIPTTPSSVKTLAGDVLWLAKHYDGRKKGEESS